MGTGTWRRPYAEVIKELKSALKAKGVTLALEGRYEHHFMLAVEKKLVGTVFIKLGTTGTWRLGVEWYATLRGEFEPMAVFLTGGTRGYVMDAKQLEHQHKRWKLSLDGTQYEIREQAHLRGASRFQTADECAMVLAEMIQRRRGES